MARLGRHFCLFATLLAFASTARAEASSAPVAGDDPLTSPRTAWFRDARFGMFIHWGLYSVAGGEWNGKPVNGTAEWIMENGHIPWPEYELLARDFNPIHFDANAWVAVAKDAGMRYLVVTAKHHDGFCMWATKTTPFNVADATPFRRDAIQELSVACKKAGMKFGIYYSIMDWHRDELAGYWNAGHGAARDPRDPRVIRYIEGQLKPQIRELIVENDPDLLWFDGEWVPWWDAGHGKDLEAFCRRLKPRVIINNRVGKRTMTDGDYETPEQMIPKKGAVGRRLWETCMTLNDTWGYSKLDQHWKQSPEIIEKLVAISQGGGNFLLNVGPDSGGEIPRESVMILHEVGRWVRANEARLHSSNRRAQKGAP